MNPTENQLSTMRDQFLRLTNRTCVSIAGRDRHRLLHSFCTADIKLLKLHRATEAFVLNDKGKILWHGLVLSMDTELLLIGAGTQAATLMAHLERYVIRDDVQLIDRSANLDSFFIFGPTTNSRLSALVGDLPDRNEISVRAVGDVSFTICQLEVAGWGYLLLTNTLDRTVIETWLRSADLTCCSAAELEYYRIENQTPWYGDDMDDSNLPQELQRDQKAISFHKGCYLGQETVARIDAIGRVNQLLVGLEIESTIPPESGMELQLDGKVVGRLTSVAHDHTGTFVGLGYVRRGHSAAGTKLTMLNGTACIRLLLGQSS